MSTHNPSTCLLNHRYIQYVEMQNGEIHVTTTNYPKTRPEREEITGDIIWNNDTFRCNIGDVKSVRTVLNPEFNITREPDNTPIDDLLETQCETLSKFRHNMVSEQAAQIIDSAIARIQEANQIENANKR